MSFMPRLVLNTFQRGGTEDRVKETMGLWNCFETPKADRGFGQ